MSENADARTGLVAAWESFRTALSSASWREFALLRLREALIIAALIAGPYYLAKIVWLLAPFPQPEPAPLTPSLAHPAALQPPPPAPTDVQEINNWQLFGELQQELAPPPGAESAPAAAAEIDVKNLRLRGVIFNPRNPANARASIAANNKAEWYLAGDTLVERETVVDSIARDHVILREGELTHTLELFPKGGSGSEPERPENLKTVDMRDNKRATTVASKYRERLAKDPGSAAKLLHFSPVRKDGDIVGYRVRPKRSRSDFFALGLKSGDIINAINGVMLDSLVSLQTAQNRLNNDNEAQVLITRRNKPVELLVKFQ